MKCEKLYVILSLYTLLTIVGCVKEKNIPINGSAKIIFNISGIEESPLKSSSNKSLNRNDINSNYQNLEEFDVVTILKEYNESNEHSNTKIASTQPISNNITYRILIYRNVNNVQQFVDSIDLTKNGIHNTREIGITRGVEYKWYAYSYNDTNTLPVLTSTQLEDATVHMGINKDFLYDSGSFQLMQSGTQTISIIFKRKTAQITLDFDGRGLFTDTIKEISIEIPHGILKTANFELKNNTISSTHQQINNLEIPYSAFQNTENNYYDRKMTHIHTVSVDSLNYPSITLKNLKIKLDDNTTRTFSQSTISFTTKTGIALGRRTTANVYLIESALTYANVEWARANLYRKDNGRNPYRFYHTNKQTNDPRSYFSFRGHIPRKFASAMSSEQKDPCALVFPSYRWIQPSATHIGISEGKLSHSGGALTNILTTITDAVIPDPTEGADSPRDSIYIEYSPTPVSSTIYPITSRKLRFYFNGLHANIAVLQDLDDNGLVTLSLGNYGRVSTFWTNEQGVNLLQLVQVGAWGYLGTRKASITGPFAKGISTANILNIGLLGTLNVIRSPLLNVRCIRNPAWPDSLKKATYNPVPQF